MHIKKISVLIGLFMAVFTVIPAFAVDAFKDEAAMRAFADDVMKKVGSGDLTEALDTIRPHVHMNKIDFDSAVTEATQQRQKFAMRYGPSAGYEFLGHKKIGDSLYRLQYIEKTKKQALGWAFYFYKSDDGWIVDEFQWDDQMSKLFQSN